MKPYYQDEWVTQYCSDALTILRGLEGDTVDLLVTDPPYGISFMGKSWDKALPDKAIWAECLRVLKPGAFAFVMSIPRSDCLARMIISLQDVGFRVDFTPIFWAYASGFPKAQNMGKAADKKPNRLLAGQMRDKLNELRIKRGFSIKQVNDYFGFATTGSGVAHHWLCHPTQPTIPNNNQYQKLKEWWQLDDSLDELYYEAERELTGIDSSWGKEGSTPLTRYGEFERRDKPSSLQAKALDGSYGGFQPKPAVEVIIVAMKPLSEKTFVDQALKNGHGITWLDDCRVPYESDGDKEGARFGTQMDIRGGNLKTPIGVKATNVLSSQYGRFPANLLVSDDALNDGRVTGSGRRVIGGAPRKHTDHIGQLGADRTNEVMSLGDSGSFSRYFDLDKWWTERIKQLPESVQKTFPFLIVPKASKSEKNKGLGSMPDAIIDTQDCNNLPAMRTNSINTSSGNLRNVLPTKNYHPTVKPLKLMSYLITLGSREGDIIIDPFSGSGTTALASKLLGRKCVGIEIEEKYCEIAANRCSQGVFNLTK
ncbi:hypothetical protein LCGC14_0917250 [marine sediment metagenome]|uniref:DNA methylase N-4/N-6 domain-containing protein n=1 Tax=marine sediment metagenome TaxID=412755 RepID=A0A0F9NWL1_9ZZZZ